MSTYEATLAWLYQQLPMFQRQGAAAFKKDLTRTWQLMELLQEPQKGFASIHIAGTNGKGSVAHSLAAVLQEAGYQTGLYTSPHLQDFRERIRINGQMISREAVVQFVQKHQKALQDIGCSFFEMTVALAFQHFARQPVDIAVVETGMGGRLDSTNVLRPELSIITNIGLDHTQFLGDTLPAIAGEKAGIIKAHTPVLIGRRQVETVPVFEAKAREEAAPLSYAEALIPPEKARAVWPHATAYQLENTRTTLAALQLLQPRYPTPGVPLADTLARLRELTGLRGRWETLAQQPLTIADTGHNEAGLRLSMEQLQRQSYRQLHIVWGMVSDKNHPPLLALLPTQAHFYWCCPDVPRGLPAPALAQLAQSLDRHGSPHASVMEAVQTAQQAAHPRDLIFIGGSTFVVAEALSAFE
ncbi:MAG: folylpolyglutamate synthase/dihydrofolate synthase family protein [Schleiferiaceae bacterium]|nr:folylpolyglutamate synthase/dihydrofolate synthase family protein [Schleiferiaceae bacterium]